METENTEKKHRILSINDKIYRHDKTYHEILGPEDLVESHRMIMEEMQKYNEEDEKN